MSRVVRQKETPGVTIVFRDEDLAVVGARFYPKLTLEDVEHLLETGDIRRETVPLGAEHVCVIERVPSKTNDDILVFENLFNLKYYDEIREHEAKLRGYHDRIDVDAALNQKPDPYRILGFLKL